MRGGAGFSLIEVLVVVAITSTLAVGATLIWSRAAGPETGTVEFQQDVAALRRLAMLTGAEYRLNLSQGGWHAMRRGLGGWSEQPGHDHQITISQAPETLRFFPDGRVSEARIVLGAAPSQSVCETGGAEEVTCRAN